MIANRAILITGRLRVESREKHKRKDLAGSEGFRDVSKELRRWD
jgi:hypothetical protein